MVNTYFIQSSSLPGYLESLKKKRPIPTSPLKATSFIILIISKAYIIDVVHFNMLIYTHEDNVHYEIVQSCPIMNTNAEETAVTRCQQSFTQQFFQSLSFLPTKTVFKLI